MAGRRLKEKDKEKKRAPARAAVDVDVPYDRWTFDMIPTARPVEGADCFVHQMKPGSRILVCGVPSTVLEVSPGSVLVSRQKRATVPGKVKGDARREVMSSSAVHICRNTEVTYVEAPPPGWRREEEHAAAAVENEEVGVDAGPAVHVPARRLAGKGVRPRPEADVVDAGSSPGAVGAVSEKGKPGRAEAPPGSGLVGWCEAVLVKNRGMKYNDVVKELEKVAPGHGKNHKWVANVAFKMRKEGRL